MKILCKNKYWQLNKDYNLNKILYLLIDRPNIINSRNDFVWENKQKQIHRDYDLPTILEKNGYLVWYKNGNCYRKNKPAIIWNNGYKEYWKK